MMKQGFNLRQFLPAVVSGVLSAAVLFACVSLFTLNSDSKDRVQWSKTFEASAGANRFRRGTAINDAVSLEDVFISVKTSGKFHGDRLGPIVKTWFRLARRQVGLNSTTTYPDGIRTATGPVLLGIIST